MRPLNPWRLWRPIYNVTWGLWQQSSYRHFARFTHQQRNLTILDVGTGVGNYIKYISGHNRYVFTEPDKVALKKAELIAARYLPQLVAKGKAIFKVGYGDDVLQKSPKVDVIVLIHVLSVVPRPKSLVTLALKKLKPGGRLMIYVNTRQHFLFRFFNPLVRLIGFRFLNMTAILPAGYRVEKAGKLNACYIVQKGRK
ncbi:MAG: class I SAM-dependent methyltransferase [Alphaproteobacteria bacterium]|nr:class I SAM-dependent methyltransferase [Alphaproteobacteria bacterium]